MTTFKTENRHGYSVKFSPNRSNLLAIATSQYYGFKGGGTLFLVSYDEDRCLISKKHEMHWDDGLFDVVWSRSVHSLLVTGSGDGSVQMWNYKYPQKPVRTFNEHKKEVCGVDWCQNSIDDFLLSASWDCSVKLWDPNKYCSLTTYKGHDRLVYEAKWSPFLSSCFASVSGDGMLDIWDCSSPLRPSVKINAHQAEILSCSWNQFYPFVLATGGAEGLIRIWDIRKLLTPIFQLEGCQDAVKRVQCSPHHWSVLVSASYDCTTKYKKITFYFFFFIRQYYNNNKKYFVNL
ncbi:peroxisomal targeting signal 2 receptor isoform X1 [Aphis gossypii]|uniref:peroxisomal targeting signal 2 receptor isoform X1 n=1 Tax=Aphis gossypii TaxID=80765 RepID=UPI00215984DF|nr:peroxisomal targeting signal 2 receptor isoform X1 [Aphis gossypii]XP_027843532.2 peroxisomal targeting signal 2 receptor isoform X1 [Aphis gossypii]XP_050057370.1 peroxisomal targeting signal 2 receptor isoform X1 [Aphis gossypii]